MPFGIFIHHFPPVPPIPPGPINEAVGGSRDFNGLVGVCRVTGAGQGPLNLTTGATTRLSYQVDNGFMSGPLRRRGTAALTMGPSPFV